MIAKVVLGIMIALCSLAAWATNDPPEMPISTSSASQDQMQQQKQDQTQSAQGGNVGGSHSWAVGFPSHGSPSYSGMYSICVRGHGGWFWGMTPWTWAPDPECIELVARLTKLQASPLPRQSVQILTQPTVSAAIPPVITQTCVMPDRTAAKPPVAARGSSRKTATIDDVCKK